MCLVCVCVSTPRPLRHLFEFLEIMTVVGMVIDPSGCRDDSSSRKVLGCGDVGPTFCVSLR